MFDLVKSNVITIQLIQIDFCDLIFNLFFILLQFFGVQKFQDFAFEMSKHPEASEVLSFLLNEVLRSASIQSITSVCSILGPTSNYERLGFLTLKQVCGHINASIFRGDLLLCKHILENILFETDYVYQTYDTQDESPRSERYTSVSPMLLAVHRHDAAVTNLLMTFG